MGKGRKGKKAQKRGSKTGLILSVVVLAGILSGIIAMWSISDGEEDYLVPPGGEDRPVISPALFVGRTARAYEIAREHPELMDKIWCYCGCVRNSGHRSLKTCFINRHASYCEVCIREAIEVKRLYEKGYTLDRIRKAIHKMFAWR